MQRVKRSTAVAVMPAAPNGGTPGFFTGGNPQGGQPATVAGYEWYNGVQEELMSVIEGQGFIGSSTDNTLLRQAIIKMIQTAQHSVILNNATFAPAVTGQGKAVYWDSANNRFDLAIADGSAKQNVVGFADVPNGNVYCFGDAVLFSGLTPGAYYLSGTTAGSITQTAPAYVVIVGIAKGATELLVDIDLAAVTVTATNDASFSDNSAKPASTSWIRAAIQSQAATIFTTGGTNTAYTLTPLPAITANGASQKFRVIFHAPPGLNPTLSVSGKPALNLKYKDPSGTKWPITAVQIPTSGWTSDVENDGTDWIVLNVANPGPISLGYKFVDWSPINLTGGNTPSPSTGTGTVNNGVISGSISAGVLTLSFVQGGSFLVTVNYEQAHANTYTASVLTVTLGGTATRYISPATLTDTGQPNPVNSNSGGSVSFLVSAAAGQTLSISGNLSVTGSGTNAQHTASLSVAAVAVGS